MSAYNEADRRVYTIAMESYLPTPEDEAGRRRHEAASEVARRYQEIARLPDFRRVMSSAELKQLADDFDAEFNPEPPSS